MSDNELIERFEGLSLQPCTFHHADHVQLAFAYLKRHDLLDALRRYREGLKRFVEHVGNPDLLRWRDGALFAHYGADVLSSDVARRALVLPGPR